MIMAQLRQQTVFRIFTRWRNPVPRFERGRASARPIHRDLRRNFYAAARKKRAEAGVVIAGGHTVQDKEPKYGLVVIGFVHPQKMLSKGGLKAGDALVLTKPLGFGVHDHGFEARTSR